MTTYTKHPSRKSKFYVPNAPLAMRIQDQLHELEFALLYPRPIAHGTQIRPRCGVVINVFNTGAVVVQGRFIASAADESLPLLRKVLPATTIWQCGSH